MSVLPAHCIAGVTVTLHRKPVSDENVELAFFPQTFQRILYQQ
jgi:hypothetical protein